MKEPIRKLVMEGSENCQKSEVKGAPFDFNNPPATTASAHVYQAAARSLSLRSEDFKMVQQGFRALYDDEDFDKDARANIQSLGKPMEKARMEAGTIASFGDEAKRRAALKVRPLVCGVIKLSASRLCGA